MKTRQPPKPLPKGYQLVTRRPFVIKEGDLHYFTAISDWRKTWGAGERHESVDTFYARRITRRKPAPNRKVSVKRRASDYANLSSNPSMVYKAFLAGYRLGRRAK